MPSHNCRGDGFRRNRAMKKTEVIIIALIASFVIFASCQKKQNWNCSCGVINTSKSTYTTTISNATKNNAVDLCNKAGGANLPNGSYDCNVTAAP